MRACVSAEALQRKSCLSDALSQQMTNQAFKLKLQPTSGEEDRWRVVSYVREKDRRLYLAEAFDSAAGGLEVVSRRKRPLGLALNPDIVEDYSSGASLDCNCRSVEEGIYWRAGEADFFHAGKLPLHADILDGQHLAPDRTPQAGKRSKQATTQLGRPSRISSAVPFEARVDNVQIYPPRPADGDEEAPERRRRSGRTKIEVPRMKPRLVDRPTIAADQDKQESPCVGSQNTTFQVHAGVPLARGGAAVLPNRGRRRYNQGSRVHEQRQREYATGIKV